MSLKAAMWVSGTSVEPERTGSWLNTTRAGWGSHFRTANTSNWFHIPITTPVILEDQRPHLSKAFVFFATKGNAKITAVHFYDGQKKVKALDNLALQGDHFAAPDATNSWVLSPALTVSYSLGISVCVEFGAFNQVVPEVVFYSAGADFTA